MTAIDIPQDLSGITPVGMTAQAGMAGVVIAELAEQKRGLPGWQAFHYEQISAQQFEVTGGVLDPSLSGMRKFSGPHDTVVLESSAILHALQARLLAEQVTTDAPPARPQLNLHSAKTAQTLSADPMQSNSKTGHLPYLQVTLALPDDPEARTRLLARLATGMEIDGASVLACALLPAYPSPR